MINQFINKIHQGNSLDILKQMPDSSVDNVITSPPYWQLFGNMDNILYLCIMKRDKGGRFVKGTHWRPQKSHWDKDWFYQKYFIEKLSTTELARLCDCNHRNISYWMKKHGFKGRTISQVRKIKYWGSKGKLNGMYGRNGNNNPNWKGGISPERQAFYCSNEWLLVAQKVWKRDKAFCQNCNKKKKINDEFHIHHIISFSEIKLRTELSNLVLLCKKCHNWVHSKANTTKLFIGQ